MTNTEIKDAINNCPYLSNNTEGTQLDLICMLMNSPCINVIRSGKCYTLQQEFKKEKFKEMSKDL